MNATENRIKKTGLGARASRTISNAIIYVVLGLMTIVWLFPFFGIMLESFRVETRMQVGYLWPEQFGWDNYIRLFNETDFLRWFGNTAFMVEQHIPYHRNRYSHLQSESSSPQNLLRIRLRQIV